MKDEQAWLWFVTAAFATWRVTHLLAYEDGPWDIVARIRRWASDGFWARLMDCFYCLSLWVAAAVSALRAAPARDWILEWLAISGIACLLDRLTQEPVTIQPMNEGDASNAVLRTEQASREDRGGSGQAG